VGKGFPRKGKDAANAAKRLGRNTKRWKKKKTGGGTTMQVLKKKSWDGEGRLTDWSATKKKKKTGGG